VDRSQPDDIIAITLAPLGNLSSPEARMHQNYVWTGDLSKLMFSKDIVPVSMSLNHSAFTCISKNFLSSYLVDCTENYLFFDVIWMLCEK